MKEKKTTRSCKRHKHHSWRKFGDQIKLEGASGGGANRGGEGKLLQVRAPSSPGKRTCATCLFGSTLGNKLPINLLCCIFVEEKVCVAISSSLQTMGNQVTDKWKTNANDETFYSLIDGAHDYPLLSLKAARYEQQITILITRAATIMLVCITERGEVVFGYKKFYKTNCKFIK